MQFIKLSFQFYCQYLLLYFIYEYLKSYKFKLINKIKLKYFKILSKIDFKNNVNPAFLFPPNDRDFPNFTRVIKFSYVIFC